MGGTGSLVSFLPMVVIFLIFYVVLIMPQQKRVKAQKKMLEGLKKGDRVITNGGIIATIVGLKGNLIELKIAEGTVVQAERTAVTSLFLPEVIPGKSNDKPALPVTNKEPKEPIIR
ncbi:MAG: preprotein translocase subunit YajC [Elusimicrobiota bacterium]